MIGILTHDFMQQPIRQLGLAGAYGFRSQTPQGIGVGGPDFPKLCVPLIDHPGSAGGENRRFARGANEYVEPVWVPPDRPCPGDLSWLLQAEVIAAASQILQLLDQAHL
jgi:hypothetical protein